MQWGGTTTIVTGASRGIGRAVAEAAADRGARVGVIARSEDGLREVVAGLGDIARYAVADVADPEALAAAIDRLEAELGPTDVMVANAGIGAYGAFADLGAEEAERLVRVNVLGTVHALRAVVPGMIERRRGHLVTIGSIAGRIGSPFEAIYSATKFAGVGLTEALAVELEPYGVGVSLVNPGPVATDFGAARGHPYDRARPRPVPAADVARAVVRAVEDGRAESYVPPSFRPAVAIRHLVPPLFRWGTRRSFTREPAVDRARAVRALVFGTTPEPWAPPPGANELTRNLASTPCALRDVPDAEPLRPDWVVTRPRLTGICGSDAKQVLLDFEGDSDSAMSGLCSFPQVLGHEVVAEVSVLGPQAEGVEVGQRVVLNPWLSCVPRGITPVCPACEAGDLSLCWSFTTGPISPGLHTGVSSDATGGFAELMPAHPSMLFAVPDAIDDQHAILADPFAVSLHSVTRHPPPAGGRALVWGAGALGSCAVAILRALHPDVEVGVVARFDAQADLAARLGAHAVFRLGSQHELVEQLAAWSGGVLRPTMEGLDGLPMCHPGGIDVAYDTVARPETFEVEVRVLRARGTLVKSGVHAPGRWEWSPLYFKEISWVGSNAFGIEEVEGARRHGIEHYLDLAATGRVDLTGLLTHTYALSAWREAFAALADQGRSGAVKVALDPAR